MDPKEFRDVNIYGDYKWDWHAVSKNESQIHNIKISEYKGTGYSIPMMSDAAAVHKTKQRGAG